MKNPTSTNSPRTIATNATLSINNQGIHTNLTEVILHAYHDPILRTHILEHTGWDISTFSKVDWKLTRDYVFPLYNHHDTNIVNMCMSDRTQEVRTNTSFRRVKN